MYRMKGWKDEWMNEWMKEWKDEWMNKWIEWKEYTDEWTYQVLLGKQSKFMIKKLMNAFKLRAKKKNKSGTKSQ